MVIGNSRGYISLWNHAEVFEEVWTDAEIDKISISKKIHDNSITVLKFNRESKFFEKLNKKKIFFLAQINLVILNFQHSILKTK